MDLHRLVARRIDSGQSVERVEAELLASVPELSEERQAALWLYARCLSRDAWGSRTGGRGGLVHEAS
jgi:hypothetical protein